MKALSGFYYVDDGTSVTACRGRGKLRHQKISPLVGDRVEMGGLLGSAPVMPVHDKSSADFVARGGRIPAPIQSLKN